MVLSVRVNPRSSRAEVLGPTSGELRVRLTAPPAGGEANAQLLRLLAKALGIGKSRMKIIKGHSSRSKQILIEDLSELNFK